MRSDLPVSIGFEGCAVASSRIDYAGAPRLVGGDLRLIFLLFSGMRSDLPVSIGFEGCAVASSRIDYAGAPRLVGGDLRLSHAYG
jgi:hypothetical protein